MADPVFPAEGRHPPRALDAEPRLVRARTVVDAGVDDAAILAGLVRREAGLFFENDRLETAQRVGRGQAHDAAADDRDHAYPSDFRNSALVGYSASCLSSISIPSSGF